MGLCLWVFKKNIDCLGIYCLSRYLNVPNLRNYFSQNFRRQATNLSLDIINVINAPVKKGECLGAKELHTESLKFSP